MKIKTNKYKKIIVVLSLCTILSACSVPQRARDNAKLISGYTVKVQKDMEDFGEFRKKLAQARYDNIEKLRTSAINTEYGNNTELMMWNIENMGTNKKDERLLLFDEISRETKKALDHHLESENRKEETRRFIAEMKSTINVNSIKLTETAKALANLGEDVDFRSQARFLLVFLRETNSALEELKNDSEKDANVGEEATTTVETVAGAVN